MNHDSKSQEVKQIKVGVKMKFTDTTTGNQSLSSGSSFMALRPKGAN